MECGVRSMFVKHYSFHHFNRLFLDVNLKWEECEAWKYICSLSKNSGYFCWWGQFMFFRNLGRDLHPWLYVTIAAVFILCCENVSSYCKGRGVGRSYVAVETNVSVETAQTAKSDRWFQWGSGFIHSASTELHWNANKQTAAAPRNPKNVCSHDQRRSWVELYRCWCGWLQSSACKSNKLVMHGALSCFGGLCH